MNATEKATEERVLQLELSDDEDNLVEVPW